MDDIFLALMFLIFFVSWIADELNLIPHFFTWSIEFLISILFFNFLLPKIVFFKKINLTPIGKYLLLIIFYSLIGSFIYLINFNPVLLGLRAFFKYGFLFLIFINSNFSKNSYKKMFGFWLFLMAIQPIIAMIQYLIPMEVGNTNDAIAGTLLTTTNAAILLIIFIICLIDLLNKDKVKNYILYSLIFLSAIVIPVLGETKGFFYFLPIIFLIRYFHIIRKFQIKKIGMFVLSFLVILYFFRAFFQVNLFDFSTVNMSKFLFRTGGESVTTEGGITQNTIARSISERYLSLLSLYNFLNEKPSRIIFGDGLGSKVFSYETRKGFSITSEKDYLVKYALPRMIVNIGLVGFFIFCFMLWKISYYAYNASFRTNDEFLVYIYRIIPAFSFLYLIALPYAEPFEDAVSFSYWFFVSSLMYISNIDE